MTAAAVQLLEQQRRECFDRWQQRKAAEKVERVRELAEAYGPAPLKNRILARYHFHILCKALEREYSEREKRADGWQALHWLECFEEQYLRLRVPLLNVCSHDKALKDAAETLARKCERTLLADIAKHREGRDGPAACEYALSLVETICTGAGVKMPPIADCHRDDKHKVAAVVMRLTDPKWWRGQIRKAQARQLETAARRLGLTCKKTGGYVSGLSLLRRRQQKRRNRSLLENLIAENDQGQVYTLAQLSDLGVSNPVNRRNELMTRIRGCEEWAEAFGDHLQAVFLTATCPSRFHAYNRGGKRYDNWDGSTPIDGQQWLNRRWQLLRAYYEKRGIRFYGLRIAEPHHDGCPHWHIVMWFDKRQVKLAMLLFAEIWRGIVRPRWVRGADGRRRVKARTGVCHLDCMGGEPGAEKRRTKIVYLNKGEGARLPMWPNMSRRISTGWGRLRLRKGKCSRRGVWILCGRPNAWKHGLLLGESVSFRRSASLRLRFGVSCAGWMRMGRGLRCKGRNSMRPARQQIPGAGATISPRRRPHAPQRRGCSIAGLSKSTGAE
ncbi:replication endonuclease [Microbulbifer taiwanensis]|uniref:Replication endonuclease n=1 Tax=Microbulbifer taiwanensis TaxID=986746 RepID=A0ABW1YUJ4_9GAMM